VTGATAADLLGTALTSSNGSTSIAVVGEPARTSSVLITLLTAQFGSARTVHWTSAAACVRPAEGLRGPLRGEEPHEVVVRRVADDAVSLFVRQGSARNWCPPAVIRNGGQGAAHAPCGSLRAQCVQVSNEPHPRLLHRHLPVASVISTRTPGSHVHRCRTLAGVSEQWRKERTRIMGLGSAPDLAGSRGKVVMLVDNVVRHDSRVQKVARSMADGGFDVTLLGQCPPGQGQSWKIGQAEVRLIPLWETLNKRRHQFRRPWLRRPFAYPPTGIAQHRQRSVAAWRADLRVRFALLSLAAQSGTASRLSERMLQCELLAAKVIGRWVAIRSRQLRRSEKARGQLSSRRDRAFTWFWQMVKGDRAWRRLEPALWEYELVFGPVIDELAPDIIHANDFRMLGVGARAMIRARGQGRPTKLVWDAHEFLPGIRPRSNHVRWLPGQCAHEREYARYADAVTTVSENVAERLQKTHNLAQRPTVILNAPAADHGPEAEEPVPSLRELCGLSHDVPLLVYSGAAAKQRGVDIMIRALAHLDDVHVALVVVQPSAYVQQLLTLATELGVADRVHTLPYVSHWHVVQFLSEADAGVIPIHRVDNHELALITKFFEYSHARLPIIVSDVKTMAETVRTTGQGEVFCAEDLADYVRAVGAVLGDPQRYRSAYDEPGLLDSWTWEAQADALDAVYTRLLQTKPHSTDATFQHDVMMDVTRTAEPAAEVVA